MRPDFKNLLVWRQAHQFTLDVYQITRSFPEDERFGLTSQLRRAVISIESNIAEGNARNTIKDFIQFLYIARGSLAETESQLLIAKDLGYISSTEYNHLDDLRISIAKLLNLLIKKLLPPVKS